MTTETTPADLERNINDPELVTLEIEGETGDAPTFAIPRADVLDVTITMSDEPTGRHEHGYGLFDYVLTSARNGEIARGRFDDTEAERIAQAHIDAGADGWNAGDVVWDV